jgi:hypothetical protein
MGCGDSLMAELALCLPASSLSLLSEGLILTVCLHSNSIGLFPTNFAVKNR